MSTSLKAPDQFDFRHKSRGRPAALPDSFQSTATRILVVWLSKSWMTSKLCAATPGYLLATVRPSHSAVTSERFQGSGSVRPGRSEEHTSELQSLMRISYAVFCLKKKNKPI